ncbi:hypothetical protein Kpol_1061p27 [Vanderwaltozyma polyspora DSM 70294]|uniref:Pirin N-terminal domain-containing protein n=1 Tax=Vanderwaltozyma polyspora (strain ATCC 22028 / DSM 70294 / BCRC 21397 / CBS 2163 / NBRC 10782 / NRRL Y-8283 / UCD 57-17) TaxID=436907 RepID=A7TJF3_VANPO|nr:uncharacterized protein Kpol_1061p27 [Vanderwaltozyma polyspora DSM 70294]EDO17603.1 hypothetical protein Kpol_1061p27 [Vanderwaltozyma polyspora DSM 70294]
MSKQQNLRSIFKHFISREQSEGVGARVRRSIGTMLLRKFSPFLMLDHFNVAPGAGFPDHPHHGQETITYVNEGMIAHEDFTGCKGVLGKGDLQFMTAGKAICHAEMPVQSNSGEHVVGLQLWVDLPTDMKNTEPRYRDLRNKDIPRANPTDDLEIEVISGNSYGVDSVKDLAYTPIDFYMYRGKKAGTEFTQKFSRDFNVFIYVLKGAVNIGDQVFPQYSSIFFNTDGDAVGGTVAADDTEFAIIGGKILDQETVQHGPFVEETKEKLIKVFYDYQSYSNGFERARNWRSSIRDGIKEDDAPNHHN